MRRVRAILLLGAAVVVVAITAAALGATGVRQGVHEVRGREACGLWPRQFALCVVTEDGVMYQLDHLALPQEEAPAARLDRLARTLPTMPGAAALRLTAVELIAALEIDAYTHVRQLRRERPAWSCADESCSMSPLGPGQLDVEMKLNAANIPSNARYLMVTALVEQSDQRVTPRSWGLKL